MTLTSYLAETAHRFGPTPAYVAENGLVVSYADLARVSDEVAVGLAERGIDVGDVVGLVLPTIPEYIVAYLAAAKLGAITAGVNIRLSEPEQQGVLDVAQPQLVVSAAELSASAAVDSMLDGLRVRGSAPPPLDDDPDRPVALVFTSATT